MVPQFRQCKECKQWLPERFFPANQKTGLVYKSGWRQRTCMGCRDKIADARKAQNRFIKKAKNAIYNHGQKAIEAGLARNLDEFRALYGWDVQQMAHDMAHAYENGCPICHGSYKEMGHGLRDLTIDIINPIRPPHYGINTQYICSTDNTRKQRTDPADYGEVMLGWRLWEAHQQQLNQDEWAGTLFEGITNTKQLKLGGF